MLFLSFHYIFISIRVTFDSNLLHLAEGLFKNVFAELLHIYCLGQDRSNQAFARPEIFYYSVIMVVLLSR